MGATVRRGLVLGAMIVGLALAPAAADVYRWVDEQGQVHFGDRPPADKDSERVKTRPPASAPTPAAAPSLGGQAKDDAPAAGEAGAPSPPPDPGGGAERCAAIREKITYLQTHPRVFVPEEKRWLVGDSHAAEVEHLKGLLADECADQ